MSTDFFDSDLLHSSRKVPPSTGGDELTLQPISGASITRMVRQKEELSNQVSGAVREIELLKRKQEDLEKEKKALEELSRKQSEYETGKKDIIEKLAKSVVIVEKDEAQATRMLELLSETRRRFRDMLAEMRQINEAEWTEENYEGELNRAYVLVENVRTEYRKLLSKIEAADFRGGAGTAGIAAMEPGLRDAAIERSFGYWVKVGFAVTLPLLVLLLILTYIVLRLPR